MQVGENDSVLGNSSMDDLLGEFLTESTENLAQLDNELVNLEKNPNNPELLRSIFRTIHTIKGTCGFIGLPRLEKVAHAGENVLGKIRDNVIEVTPDVITIVLECIDAVKMILVSLAETGAEPEGDDTDLINRLNAMANQQGDAGAHAATEESITTPDIIQEAPPAAAEVQQVVESAETQVTSPPAAEPPAEPATPEAPKEEVQAVKEPIPTPASAATEEAKAADKAAQKIPIKADADASLSTQTIRVNVALLENLMTMVSELVLTRNQLMQMIRENGETAFSVPLQRLNHITSELQESVMKTRMQPIGNAWTKMPRLVRDLAHELGKKVELEMIGAETELDRQVIELIKDPLTHMVRNSADHGLETIEGRIQAGKSETGKIVLNAYHAGGHIIIEIADDGRGLPIDKIKAKAIANKLATAEQLEGMSDSQIYQFIFKSGFSTAEKITNISGRGVGMDVVRSNVEKIGGTIDVKSNFGQGSVFTIKIPLTLAIVSALIAETKGYKFAVPQLSVLELVRVANDSENEIEYVNDQPVLRLRNRLLPLISLERLLKIDAAPVEAGAQNSYQDQYIVVLQVGMDIFGLIVDQVFDTQEIVVKPVSMLLKDLNIFAGNTILGDGSVIMILDPNGIASALGDGSISKDNHEAASNDKTRRGTSDKESFLIFDAGDTAPKAVPLAQIARLEKIDLSNVEFSHDEARIQYRGALMPLVSLNPQSNLKDDGHRHVLVFSNQHNSLGLVVDRIVDVIEERMELKLKSDDPGCLGTFVINGKATDIIDTDHYIRQVFPEWYSQQDISEHTNKTILCIGDYAFGKNLLVPLLQFEGYHVENLVNTDEFLARVENGEAFDIVVCDLETGQFESETFVKKLRQNKNWGDKPIIAITSNLSPAKRQSAQTIGFTDCFDKFDRQALIERIAQHFDLSLTEFIDLSRTLQP